MTPLQFYDFYNQANFSIFLLFLGKLQIKGVV